MSGLIAIKNVNYELACSQASAVSTASIVCPTQSGDNNSIAKWLQNNKPNKLWMEQCCFGQQSSPMRYIKCLANRLILFSLQSIAVRLDNRPPLFSGPSAAFADVASNAKPAERDIMPALESKLSDTSYLPAVMQALAYYVELIQYEPAYSTTIEPPYTIPAGDPDGQPTTSKPFTTTRAPWTTTTRAPWSTTSRSTTTWAPWTTTTRAPYTTTTAAAWSTTTRGPWGSVEATTQFHRPGQFAPSQSPNKQHRPVHDGIVKPVAVQLAYKPTTTRKPFVAQVGALPLLSISNNQYFDWYTQNKAKQIDKEPGDL